MAAGKRECMAEARALSESLAPMVGEFFGAYAMIGIRVGCGTVVVFASECSARDREAIDDAIVSSAMEIVKKRERARPRVGGRGK